MKTFKELKQELSEGVVKHDYSNYYASVKWPSQLKDGDTLQLKSIDLDVDDKNEAKKMIEDAIGKAGKVSIGVIRDGAVTVNIKVSSASDVISGLSEFGLVD